LLEDLVRMCDERVRGLSSLWEEMGIVDLDTRAESVRNYFEKGFKLMIREEQGHLNDIVTNIEALDSARVALVKELNRNGASGNDDDAVDGADVDFDGLPLIAIVNKLKAIIGDLETTKEQRMVEVRQLTLEDEEVSGLVGRAVLPLPLDTVLIPSEIAELRAHIKEMKELRRRRTAQLEEMQIEISSLCETLGVEPGTALERQMTMESAENCVLSDANMQAVTDFLERLQAHLKSNQAKRQDMIQRIKSLCERLNYDDETTRKYLPSDDDLTGGVTDAAVSAIAGKLEELEVLKKQHMSEFISASKRELEAVWNKCYYSEGQKAACVAFFSSDVDEETLDALETELDKMNKFYERNVLLYNKVDEWHSTWHTRLEMEARAKDKSRLLGRGRNNLLEEEKERKAVQRRLPRIEKELMTLVEAFEEANQGSQEFRLKGMSIAEYIRDAKAEHKAEVKDEREIKKDLKKKIVEQETIYGTLTPSTALTPINNMTSAALRQSRRDLTQSAQKSMSIKRPGVDNHQTAAASAKRRKMYDNSILSGNLPQHSVNSVESTTLYRDRDIVSSTMCIDSTTQGTGARGGTTSGSTRQLRTPRGGTLERQKMSTPSKSTTSLFKTPASAAATAATSGSRQLTRSGHKTVASTSSLTRGNVRKIPFKL